MVCNVISWFIFVVLLLGFGTLLLCFSVQMWSEWFRCIDDDNIFKIYVTKKLNIKKD